jgi:hypothetical protein
MPVSAVARDNASAAFFDGTARGELLIKKCTPCGHFNAPQNMMCTACASTELEWVKAAGTGRIETFAVVHRRGGAGDAPTRVIVGVVELDEGPWLEVQIVDVDPDAVKIFDPVVVGFETPEGGEALPVFRPAG